MIFAWSPQWMETVFITAHVTLAAIVTGHALLRKYDVRSAFGWIALAWLSPGLGALLYYLFGINRVVRRALQVGALERRRTRADGVRAEPDVSSNIALLSEIGQRVTGDPLLAGNRVEILRGGGETYPIMLEAIDNAKCSIALASYIFRNDAVGHAFVDALIAARSRGVAVRVLLDGIGSGYILPASLRRLHAGGVAAARFMHTWLPWRMPFLNMRNHKKLLIVDGALGFTGGLNIGAEYSSRHTTEPICDFHVQIEGPAVRQLMATFARDWSFTTGESLDGGAWWPELQKSGPVFVRGIHSGPDADLYKLETILGAALAQARRRVRIVSPYFLPDTRLQFAIAQARLRGVTVDILIPERCDYPFMDWAMRAHLQYFRDSDVQFHATPPPFDHSKLMTVDGQWSLIGSSNWDTRSLRLNFEFDLECYDESLTAKVDALIDEKIAKGQRIDCAALIARPRWIRLRNAAARLFLPYL